MAELRSKKRNTNTYAEVSRAMMERGYYRDTEQCRTKIKELRQVYQKAREANGCSGSQLHTCCFYRELHAIMGRDNTTTRPLSMDICKGGIARSEEDEFLEDEEEEEEEDSVQAASGESVFPPSQELFLTLEPIASRYSQSMLPDHDPGEGTSATGWLSLHTSNLDGEGGAAERTVQDVFIRKFIYGTFHGCLANKIVLKHRANVLVVCAVFLQRLPPYKFYFLVGYTETLLSFFYKCPVRLEVQTLPKKVIYKYL
ncbi:unnamed protein product [Natator depressus]